jgi:uncharacterized membrane protein HdeD (DUF308 family)
MSEVMGTPEPATPTPHVTSSPEEDMIRGAANLVDQNAPWKKGARWEMVLIQGIVLGVAGLIVWLAPGFGAAAILQLVALLLLVSAALSVWRLLRRRVAPARVGTVAFRAGVGLSIGIVTILGAFIVEDRDVGTRAIAVVLGVGLILYGLAALATIVFGREKGSGLPIVAIIVVALTIIVGLLLILNGRNGIDALQGTFVLLGILIAVAGLGLIGYALMLRQNQTTADTSDI